MIELADIETIRAVPGGVEMFLRGSPQRETGVRPHYTVEYSWEAAQQLANELAGLCAQEALRKQGHHD